MTIELFLRRFQRCPTLLLPQSHPTPCRRADLALAARLPCLNRGRGYRRRNVSFRSAKRRNSAVQFVALCDEEADDRVS